MTVATRSFAAPVPRLRFASGLLLAVAVAAAATATGRLAWLQGIDDHALQQLYRDSACLLVPSEGEGFGLPLIEAARQGLPVIARDLPVFREVAGAHAYYFNATDGAGLAQALRDWLALDARGAAPASAAMPWQTWADNADALLEVVQGRRD